MTSALEACVMLEFDARHVNTVSTSLLCTAPMYRDEETTGDELCREMACETFVSSRNLVLKFKL